MRKFVAMVRFRCIRHPLATFAVALIMVATATGAISQDSTTSTDFWRCLVITDNAERLRCLDKVPPQLSPRGSQNVGVWRLVRTPHLRGGADAVSIIHTADTSRSDLDLAGLTLRCGEKAVEALVVVVEPRPPRAHPEVKVSAGGDSAAFVASIVPPFSLILLPGNAATLITGPWKSRPELTIQIDGDGPTIRGVVPLAGLPAALQSLETSCGSR